MEDYFTQPVLDAVQRAKAIAEGAGVTVGQLALAWCLRRPEISAVIVGATKPAHVDENVKAAGLRVDPSVMAQFDAALRPVAIDAPYMS